MKKRLFTWFLTLVMVLGLLPTSIMAATKDTVYISASHDGEYLSLSDGGYLAHVPVELDELEEIDLAEYGLSDFKYDADNDGTYEITVLHLMIYAHEYIYGLDWKAGIVSGYPGGIFFQGGLFGLDYNLNYYFNGEYPSVDGWGLTADQIVLHDGDFVDYAHYSSDSFWWDTEAGFHYFTDTAGNATHDYTVSENGELTVTLGRTSRDYNYDTVTNPEAGYKIFYGSELYKSAGSVKTNGNGQAKLTFDESGTYYLWAEGTTVSSPAYAKVKVTAAPSYKVDFSTGEGYTIEAISGSVSPVKEGGSYSFIVKIKDGYEMDEAFAVTVNDKPVEPAEGVYTISGIQKTQTVKVSGVVKKTVPEDGNTQTANVDWATAMAKTKAYLLKQVEKTAPIVNSTYGEWLVLGLARSGVDAGSDFFDDYYQNVVSFVKNNIDANSRLSNGKSTENSRVILALGALGYDVTNVGGHNLLKGLTDRDFVVKQGINGPVWALIALDSGNYEIPENADSTKQVTREWLIDYILKNQLSAGGWSLDGVVPDDMNPMAVQALAPYYNKNKDVKAAVDKAVDVMATQNCTSETYAQIIVALSALGMDSSDAMNQMLKYAKEDGSFAHSKDSNQMATEQAFYAMVAYDRYKDGKKSLYDMSDVTKRTPAVTPSEGNGNKPSDETVVPETKEEIKVTFRLIGDDQHDDGTKGHTAYVTWIPTKTYRMEEGDTMYDVFVEAIQDHGLKQRGAENDYVESVKAPKCLGDYWLGEFDNGKNSGWMYTVDGDHPEVGLRYYELKDGDEIIWHYVDDYVKEQRNSSSEYYYRWLEAKDISPEKYVKEQEKQEEEVLEEELVVPEEELQEEVTETPVSGNISFSDVKETDWFYKDVAYAVEKGLFSGTGDSQFSPNTSMNRGMLVTVLYRLSGETGNPGSSSFADVMDGQWYHDAVLWAAENGIVHGYDNGSFGAADNVTREQMAAILFRYATYMGYDTTVVNSLASYQDKSAISPFAMKAMQWANGEGLISGRTADTLAPLGNVTRAEVASILHRFAENVVVQ